MSDDLKKALDTAMSRIASLETEVSGYRKRPAEDTNKFDPAAFRQAFVQDPIGQMTKMGVPVDHITRVMVAHAMGDEAPPHLKVLAQMGPQVSATHALDDKVETLSRQLSTLLAKEGKTSARERLHALAKDKTAYPSLSSVLESHPSYFDDDLSDGANVEDFAKRHEERLSKIIPRTASNGNADTTAPSMQSKPATAGTISGDPPPIPTKPVGVFTQEDHSKLRDEIVRKFS